MICVVDLVSGDRWFKFNPIGNGRDGGGFIGFILDRRMNEIKMIRWPGMNARGLSFMFNEIYVLKGFYTCNGWVIILTRV